MITIGQLAQRAGISSRTLRFYDEIGLLKPSARTTSGYRAYAHPEIRRLQQIQSLRAVGFSLDSIRQQLDGSSVNYREIVQAHLGKLDLQLQRLQNLRTRLLWLDAVLTHDGNLNNEDLLQILEDISMLEQQVPAAQYAAMQKRHQELGDERAEATRQEWGELIEQFRQLQVADTPLTSERAQQLRNKARRILGEFTGNDPQIQKTLLCSGPAFFAHLGYTLESSLSEYILDALR